MIRDIVFDLGKVLCPFDWTIAHQRLLPHLPPDRARLLREDERAFRMLFREPATALEEGRIDFDSFQHIIEEILGIALNEDDFHRIWCDIFSLDQEMASLGESLSVRYRTWLASNTSKVHYEWIIERFPRVAFYRDALLSYEIGIMKPDAAYYRELIRRFGIEPPQSIFIDDLEENVEAAIKAGMRGIHYRDPISLRSELRALGVDPSDRKMSEGPCRTRSA
jgi:putative hydrolase of the HAD superfamily